MRFHQSKQYMNKFKTYPIPVVITMSNTTMYEYVYQADNSYCNNFPFERPFG